MEGDRFAVAELVADATLFEGYVLYPYRASAAKNQARWQFGVLAPRAWSEADGADPWALRTEVVAEGADPTVSVRIRFLQVQARTHHGAAGIDWDEAVVHDVDLPEVRTTTQVQEHPIEIAGGQDVEDGVVRTRQPLAGIARVTRTAVAGAPLTRIAVEVENHKAVPERAPRRDEAVRHAFVAVHVLLAVDGGRFLSTIDPPPHATVAAAACEQRGSFPVLVGDDDTVVLAAPIILYDHPAVAPESQGDLFDATEIDEILALRILTLTDEEKAEARATDPRAAAVIDRCEAMPRDQLARLHGAIRSLRPEADGEQPWWTPEVDARFDPWEDAVTVGGREVAKGSRVVLRPQRRADAQDRFLAGRTAVVAGVFHDVDGEVHLAVTLEDDPGADLHHAQGRYLFFRSDEVEPR